MTRTGTLCDVQGKRQRRQDLSQGYGLTGGRVKRSAMRELGHNTTAPLLSRTDSASLASTQFYKAANLTISLLEAKCNHPAVRPHPGALETLDKLTSHSWSHVFPIDWSLIEGTDVALAAFSQTENDERTSNRKGEPAQDNHVVFLCFSRVYSQHTLSLQNSHCTLLELLRAWATRAPKSMNICRRTKHYER